MLGLEILITLSFYSIGSVKGIIGTSDQQHHHHHHHKKSLTLKPHNHRIIHRYIKREVPQEWSHEPIVRTTSDWLKKNNTDEIIDAVYALLGDQNAKVGAGKFDPMNIHCMQKRVADVAFSNALLVKDRAGAEAAIKFAGLERNTPAVGKASKECLEGEIKILNPEIARIIRHQDAASKGADEINKKSTLSVAKSLKMIDADFLTAIDVGTFKAGDTSDPTAAGFSCNKQGGSGKGCIVDNNLLVIDATVEEINKAVANVKCRPIWCKSKNSSKVHHS
ncbi:hypothetical protein CROQUDRAFT_98869 [Cronartium quercuum f. sp. fusiforme G11]|uniref:Uncharacterized protein n=1 Tax=Cronartium quercuum f. sp. fusiforme G11 TaxID=708437 RepID=A0A9P6T7C4_9BASI|nr:hypothetical protein CROQUDRAFT_98869 [Cronartium quercuum f. sp. fusiforme G11]